MNKALSVLILILIIFKCIHADLPNQDDVNFQPETSKAEYYFDKGIGHYNLNQYSEALKFLELSLQIYQNNSEAQNTAKCYNNYWNKCL